MASDMQEVMDFSPTSSEEQKVLLKELRQPKKELQVEKREVAARMKAIRTEARQQSVHAGKVFLGSYDSKLGENQRRQIRYSKESALRPQEDAKAAFERQLLKNANCLKLSVIFSGRKDSKNRARPNHGMQQIQLSSPSLHSRKLNRRCCTGWFRALIAPITCGLTMHSSGLP